MKLFTPHKGDSFIFPITLSNHKVIIMCGYWIPVEEGRIFCSTLADAYNDGAKVLLGLYRRTNGNIHRVIKGYTGSDGLPIYASRTGKSATHWVRFSNGSNPKDGWEKVSYSRAYGVYFEGPYKFPSSW